MASRPPNLQITVKNGQVQQENFPDYRLLKMADAPAEVEVHIVNQRVIPLVAEKWESPAWLPHWPMPYSQRQRCASANCRCCPSCCDCSRAIWLVRSPAIEAWASNTSRASFQLRSVFLNSFALSLPKGTPGTDASYSTLGCEVAQMSPTTGSRFGRLRVLPRGNVGRRGRARCPLDPDQTASLPTALAGVALHRLVRSG